MIFLQKFGFRESRYERPNDKWVCGRLAEGKPCSLGPRTNGRCGIMAACNPKKENGQWKCGRSPLAGGPCDAGPLGDGRCRGTTICLPELVGGRWECRRLEQDGGECAPGPLPDGRCCQTFEPCVPQPSLRERRRRSTVWATTLVVGIMALIIGGGTAGRFLMPGPLSQPHASLTDCQSCHADVDAGNLGWVHRFAVSVSAEKNAKLCMSCHDVGEQPFSPHTSPVEQLRQMTAAYGSGPGKMPIQNDSWVQKIAFPGPGAGSTLAEAKVYCASCHQEHKGTFKDLTTISNDLCQTCHVSKFGSFAGSHPEFTSYPFARRTRIIFNHKSHFGRHFPKVAEAPAEGQVVPGVCADCHVPGAGQKYMEIKTFESMCFSCHNGDILGTTRVSGPKGINFLSVPALDVATLKERGIDIGYWPEEYSEAQPTAFMRMLLAGEEKGRDALDGVAGLDLLDLSGASDEELAKVADLAWSVKRLFHKLETTKLSAAMGMEPDSGGPKMDHLQMARMTAVMPHDVIGGANREWFDNALSDDLLRHDKGEPTKTFAAFAAKKAEEKASSEETTTDAGSQPKEGAQPASASDDILGSGDSPAESGDILSQSDSAPDTGQQSDILSGDEKPGPAEAGTDILAPSNGGGDILSTDSGGGDDILSSDSSGDDILSGGSESAGGQDDILSSGGSEASGQEIAKSDASTEQATEPRFNPEDWAELGGWYRQDFVIRYRPTGHGDRFLRTWLDYAGQAFGSKMKGQMAPVFEQLAPNDAVGRCTKCHSVDDDEGVKNVKWRAHKPTQVRTRFTKFSHAPHIGAVGTEGCIACHKLTTTSSDDFLKTYEGGDPSVYSQNFVTLEKQVCAGCHTEQAVGEDCTQCHNYHPTGFSRPLVKTRLP